MPQASGSTPNSDVIVDNTNSSRILYVNPPGGSTGFIYPWQNFQAGGFYNDTYSACLQAGCRAIFTFEGESTPLSHSGLADKIFHRTIGTRVAVYGEESYCVSDTQIWSSYSINGQDNVTHISGTHSASYLLFFQSEEMPFGQYTLYIYVGYAEDDCSYNLDWIEYNTTSSVVSSASSSTPSSSSTLTATHTSQSTTSTQSSGLSRSGGTDRAAGSNTGAIAGGVAAGVVVLLTALWLAYRQWKRRRAFMGDAIFEDPSAVGEGQGTTPFISALPAHSVGYRPICVAGAVYYGVRARLPWPEHDRIRIVQWRPREHDPRAVLREGLASAVRTGFGRKGEGKSVEP